MKYTEEERDIIELYKSKLGDIECDFYVLDRASISFIFKKFELKNIYNKLKDISTIWNITFYPTEYNFNKDIDLSKYKPITYDMYGKLLKKLNSTFYNDEAILNGEFTEKEKDELRLSNLFKMEDVNNEYIPYFKIGSDNYKLITQITFDVDELEVSLRSYKLNQLI